MIFQQQGFETFWKPSAHTKNNDIIVEIFEEKTCREIIPLIKHLLSI